jgi:transposase
MMPSRLPRDRHLIGLRSSSDSGHGEEILACEIIGATPHVPKPLTSNAKAAGRFGNDDFVYLADRNAYRCPAGEILSYRFTRLEEGQTLRSYWTNRCGACRLQAKCTTSKERRVRRWEHEGIIDAMQKRLDDGNAMTVRRRTVEHTFGTIKAWMGYTHFLTRGLERVKTEMSLCVLAYNMKRMIAILGVQPLIAAVRG